MRFRAIIGAAALLGTAVAFASTGADAQPASGSGPAVEWVDPAKVPPHLDHALRAAGGRLVGRSATGFQPPVTFSGQVDGAYAALPYAPAGFAVSRVLLDRAVPATSSPIPRFAIEGLFVLATTEKRRAMVAFALRYAFDRQRFDIEEARFTPIAPQTPLVRTWLLPGGLDLQALLRGDQDFEANIRRISAQARDPATAPPLPERGDHLVIAAFYDWMPNEASTNLWLSSNAAGIDPPPTTPLVWSFGGWRVHAVRGAADLSRGRKTFAKVAYAPAPAAGVAPNAPVILSTLTLERPAPPRAAPAARR